MDFLGLRERFRSNAGLNKVCIIRVERSEGICGKAVCCCY